MKYREVDTKSEYVASLKPENDWRQEIETLANRVDIPSAWFTAFGGVEDAELWYYDQDEMEYNPMYIDEPCEVVSCIGNIFHVMVDGEYVPATHTHATLATMDGDVVAGHLNGGTVFVGEIYVREFEKRVVREPEETPIIDTDNWEETDRELEKIRDHQTGFDIWSV